MTREEKNLVIKDLCGRLPYGVKAEVMGWDEERGEEVFVPVTVYSVNTDGYVYFADNDYDITYCSIDACRLYLRPMSSMTKEEKDEYSKTCEFIEESHSIGVVTSKSVDCLNAHHFDYRGLIEKGLALEAPEGMYD